MDSSQNGSGASHDLTDSEAGGRDKQVVNKKQKGRVPADLYYSYENICSRAFTTADSNIPDDLLLLSHSFGYDCKRRANLQLLDDSTLAFVAGNMLVLVDIVTKEQRFVRSSSGGGIGAFTPHPIKHYVAVAEKGKDPSIVIYEYPSLRPYRILQGGTSRAFSFVDFNPDGVLLASVGSAPDYMLTVWDWRLEHVMLRCKACSQDVYRVSFSRDNLDQLTTSGAGHIKFWKMENTFTGLKLQGILGRFGTTDLTDIEGYIELPDGKVLSGSEWGNMLLWEGGLIKVEISRKEGYTCHNGAIQQFALDERRLMTIGIDGAIRCWDFEIIDTADRMDDTGLFEIEPMNELVVGRNVSLISMVKTSNPVTAIWFAQDSNGAIWKLDLSFSNTAEDPICLYSFHAGPIEGMDVSGSSHLMATTALDYTVRVFDFLSNKELTASRYKQGGTSLTWAPSTANSNNGLLVVGFEDGVVRLLELFNPQSLYSAPRRGRSGEAELRLRQALKPHSAAVTAISYSCNGEIMATGSTDCTVFFFAVGNRYEPVGFVSVPGPVQGLQWAPQSHEANTLLVACRSGHVLEIQAPPLPGLNASSTFHLQNLPIKHFCFHSIKSRIQRDKEVKRRQAVKDEKKKEREEMMERMKEQGTEPTEEEEKEEEEEEDKEELPSIFIPDPPSPLHCAFYAEPGAFWVSMGGYDSGYLYHCKFSEDQSTNPSQRKDEPDSFVAVQNTDHNSILTVCFSPAKQLMLCGMQDGSIRAYPLEAGVQPPGPMQAYWALSVHDNQYGSVRHIRLSHDAGFVLSVGDDGNIFSFRLKDQGEPESAMQAKVPSPRVGLETEPSAPDIEDPTAYSIETAKQKLELDRLNQEAEIRKQGRLAKLAELREEYGKLLEQNQSLPEHARLQRQEFELDPCFLEDIEREMAERLREAKRELAWAKERHRLSLKKLQARLCDVVTVSAINSDHTISAYSLLVSSLSSRFQHLKEQKLSSKEQPVSAREEQGDSTAEQDDPAKVTAEADEVVTTEPESVTLPPPAAASKLPLRKVVKIQKESEKAEKARAKIERRKREWAELYASKPTKDYEDPEDVRAIQLAVENIGDFKLKTAADFVVPEHLRMNVKKKSAQLFSLEELICQKKSEMNARVLALRDAKVELVSWFHGQRHLLLATQQRLPTEKRRPPPPVPTLTPEEMPERKMRYNPTFLQRYAAQRGQTTRQETEDQSDVLEQLWQECMENTSDGEESQPENSDRSGPVLTKLEQEMKEAEEIENLCLQDQLIKEMDEAVWRFDAELRVLRSEKLALDVQMKLAELRHITLIQELLLLEEFEKSESTLQERLNARVQEQAEVRSKLERSKHQLEQKKRDITKLQEKEKSIAATFQTSISGNKFAAFLTRVFKKKIKRVKKREHTGSDDEEEESDGYSDAESEWNEDEEDDESQSGAEASDDRVCPQGCDPALFENTVKLREHRLDLEELLMEEKKSAESLKKDCETLTEKERIVLTSLKAAEGELELLNQEKQHRLNDLDVVVPLRLHQIEYVNMGVVPADLGAALVINKSDVSRLQQRITELQHEIGQERERNILAHKHHVHLKHERKTMEAKIKELEMHCEQLMMRKFGKLVDVEVLQTLSGSKTLEEMTEKSREREREFRRELKLWQDKVADAKEALTKVTQEHTERLRSLNNLLTKKKELEEKLNTKQTKGSQFRGHHRQIEAEELVRFQQLIQEQAVRIESLQQEVHSLSHKIGHVVPPGRPCLPPINTNTPHTPQTYLLQQELVVRHKHAVNHNLKQPLSQTQQL